MIHEQKVRRTTNHFFSQFTFASPPIHSNTEKKIAEAFVDLPSTCYMTDRKNKRLGSLLTAGKVSVNPENDSIVQVKLKVK